MKIHIYRMSSAYRDYCGRAPAGPYMESLKELERRGLPTNESLEALQSTFIATKEFLAREVKSRFPAILRQCIPCFPGSTIAFCEPEDAEGWASIFIASPVRLAHLESRFFADLVVHECGQVEVSHSDGRQRPSFDIPSTNAPAALSLSTRSWRRLPGRCLV